MFDYSKSLSSFRYDKVRLPQDLKDKLYSRRDANRDRLISRLPVCIEGLSISYGNFKPQGSMAVDTIIQTKFVYEEYDIDDGIVFWRDELKDSDGLELTAEQVRNHVLEALKDNRFVKQPKLVSNAVRVFYKEEDAERHHIDFPVYRKFEDTNGKIIRELAGENGWIESDPTQVNDWFNGEVQDRNKLASGKGTQLRQLIQMLKRFCRSRNNWDLPNGMKLTMLVAECQSPYSERIDTAFRNLLENLEARLSFNKVIRNLAHPDEPELTRTASDGNVESLEDKIKEALEKIAKLDKPENNNRTRTREAWEWIFQTDGYLRDFDEAEEEQERKDREAEKAKRLQEKANLINSGSAKTTSFGVIGTAGISNSAHRFYGEDF